MAMQALPFAVVTGASTGIGFELARCCANDGYDLLIVADEPEIISAAAQLQNVGRVEAIADGRRCGYHRLEKQIAGGDGESAAGHHGGRKASAANRAGFRRKH